MIFRERLGYLLELHITNNGAEAVNLNHISIDGQPIADATIAVPGTVDEGCCLC